MRVLFATAELRPVVSAGGLGEAASGLARGLRGQGVDVDIVLPDYDGRPLVDEEVTDLWVPGWAEPARARRGSLPDVGRLTLIDVPGIARPHPYVDQDGHGWPDNDHRFAAFCAGIAALVEADNPDVLHLNDWHTGLVPGFLGPCPPTVLTIHTLGYQGQTSIDWLGRLPHRAHLYHWSDATNPMAGAIAAADRVVAVSPNYSREILTAQAGNGLHDRLVSKGADLLGILNGIDTTVWDPAADPHLAATYAAVDLHGRAACRAALLEEVGWTDDGRPLLGMVTRLVPQKGVDLALEMGRYLEGMRAGLVILGSGDRRLADWATWLATQHPDRVWFRNGYDDGLAHRIFAGTDLLMMPSRFEPCGLAQMQAMAYGNIPVVTDVGGLHDTVIDDDAHPRDGTGFVTASMDLAGLVDATHRALTALRDDPRRRAIMQRGMAIDWSWHGPAARYLQLYRELLA